MNKIREIRLKRNMTQVQLAQLLNVSQPYIHDLEKGYRGVRMKTLAKIAKVLNVSVEDLIE